MKSGVRSDTGRPTTVVMAVNGDRSLNNEI